MSAQLPPIDPKLASKPLRSQDASGCVWRVALALGGLVLLFVVPGNEERAMLACAWVLMIAILSVSYAALRYETTNRPKLSPPEIAYGKAFRAVRDREAMGDFEKRDLLVSLNVLLEEARRLQRLARSAKGEVRGRVSAAKEVRRLERADLTTAEETLLEVKRATLERTEEAASRLARLEAQIEMIVQTFASIEHQFLATEIPADSSLADRLGALQAETEAIEDALKESQER